MSDAYKYPCENCRENVKCSRTYDGKPGCAKHRKWFLWWWKRNRTVLAKYPVESIPITCSKYAAQKKPEGPMPSSYPSRVREKFRYEHPDIIRRYRNENPCLTCRDAEFCEKQCLAYQAYKEERTNG